MREKCWECRRKYEKLWGISARCWVVQRAEVCVWFCFSTDKNLPVTLNFGSIAIHGLKDIIAWLLTMLCLSAELSKQHLNFHYLQNLFLTFLINGQDVHVFWPVLLHSCSSSLKNYLKNCTLPHNTFVSLEEKVFGTSSSRVRKCSYGKGCDWWGNSSLTHNS